MSLFPLPADPVLRIALLSSFALVLITLLIMLQVLLTSERATRRARLRAAFNEAWRARFATCSLGFAAAQAPPRPPPGQRLWFLLQWNRFQQSLRGTSCGRMNAMLIALGMEKHALDLLASERPRAQLVALTTLRHLADRSHWDRVESLLSADNNAVALTAAQALVAMDAPRAVRRLLPLAAPASGWPIARLAGLCQQAGSTAVTAPLLETLEQAEPVLRGRLARLLAHADARTAAPWARRILSAAASAEERRAALRCLQEAADPRDRAPILDALGHEDPEVRLAAMQAFRRLATRDDAPRLLELLQDRSWWVRQAGADALVAVPGVDAGKLDRWLAALDDAYGRDALTRAMAETAT
jgi:HEAT repeat protein